MNDERDELLWKVVRAVVVGAVRCEDREPVGVVVGPNEVVRGGLAGRVGTIRLVLLALCECRIGRGERSVDLVGGDVEEPEGLLGRIIEAGPVRASGLEQVKGADDIGLDEFGRAMDGAIHMGLRSKVHHGTRPMLGEGLGHEFRISDIATNEGMACIPLDGVKIL